VAVLGLLVAVAWRRQRPGRRAAFFTALGVGSLLLALPFVRDLTSQIPGTYLRSPSRLVYLTTFALSLGAGAGLDLWLRSQRPRGTRLRALLAGIVVALHVADLAGHDRPFTAPVASPSTTTFRSRSTAASTTSESSTPSCSPGRIAC
jgi:hypothetical protein